MASMTFNSRNLRLAGALLLLVVVLQAFAGVRAEAPANAESSAVLEARQAQDRIDRTTEEMMRRLTEIEIEFHKKKQPLLEQRNALLKKVRGFWSRVIANHPSHEAWIRGDDKDILSYLTDVAVNDLEDSRDGHLMHHYRLELHFEPNAYFSNSVLWREVRGHAHDDGVSKVSGVAWFDGRMPTTSSFFNFFEGPGTSVHGAPRLDEHLVSEIGHVFRYEFWPHPFTYHDLPQYHELMQQHQAGDFYAQEHGEPYSPEEADAHTVDRERVEAEDVFGEGAIPDEPEPSTEDSAAQGSADAEEGSDF